MLKILVKKAHLHKKLTLIAYYIPWLLNDQNSYHQRDN